MKKRKDVVYALALSSFFASGLDSLSLLRACAYVGVDEVGVEGGDAAVGAGVAVAVDAAVWCAGIDAGLAGAGVGTDAGTATTGAAVGAGVDASIGELVGELVDTGVGTGAGAGEAAAGVDAATGTTAGWLVVGSSGFFLGCTAFAGGEPFLACCCCPLGTFSFFACGLDLVCLVCGFL